MPRALLRDLITFLFIVLTSPLWGPVRMGKPREQQGFFVSCGQFLSLFPGLPGIFLRRAYYRMTLESCAMDIGVGFGTWFSKRQVAIAPAVSIGAHCIIGSCRIGEGTLLGSNIDVLSGRHQHGKGTAESPRTSQIGVYQQVCIGRDVWVGNRAIVMADIGDHSVVGAGAVVVEPVGTHGVVVGNPARVRSVESNKGL